MTTSSIAAILLSLTTILSGLTAQLNNLKTSTTTQVAQVVSSQPVITPGYQVGVNYHSTGSDFDTTSFIKNYHTPATRALVLSQLQSMADSGAEIIKTSLWMVQTPETYSSTGTWKLGFPYTTQDLANIKTYSQDVANIVASDGHRLNLQYTMLWLGCADYVSMSNSALPFCNYSWATFITKGKQAVDDLLNTVSTVTRPDGVKVVKKVYLEGEVMIGAKANQDKFLIDLYPYFLNKASQVGVNGSLYFLVAASEGEILNNEAWTDPDYPAINGHLPLYWVYRSTEFMRKNNLTIPSQLDFSFYPVKANSPYSSLVNAVWDDFAAVYPGVSLGVAETGYFPNATQRNELGQAFANGFKNKNVPKEVVFWSTPDSGGSGVHSGFPFVFSDYQVVKTTTVTPTPTDATVSAWSAWTDTSSWSTCTNGLQSKTQIRTRTVIIGATNGGTTPSLSETQTISQSCTVAVTPTPVPTPVPPPAPVPTPTPTPTPSGSTITATPSTCTATSGSTLCTTNIAWNSLAGTATAQVFVTVAGGTPSLFGCFQSGSASAPWISSGSTYTFTLHSASSCSAAFSTNTQLANVTVTGTAQAVTPTPVPVVAPSTKFVSGQRVQTTANVNVRSTANTTGTLLGTQTTGSIGTILNGGVSQGGFYWWNVNYDSGVDGYSAEDFIVNYVALVPTDATVSAWSAWTDTSSWSTCTNSLQSKTQIRTRTIITSATNGGTTPSLSETQTVSQSCTVVVTPTPVPPPAPVPTPIPVTNTVIGTINASSNPCTVASGNSNCSSTISWNAKITSGTAQIFVKQDDGVPQLFACNWSGSEPAPWIYLNHTFTFTLHSAQNCDVPFSTSNLLNSVVVTAVNQTVTPPTVTPQPVPTPTPTPVPANKFVVGDLVKTTTKINIRSSANGTKVGSQSLNAKGVVVSGPTTAGGYTWWKVNYDSGVDGWSVEDYLIKR